MTIIIKITPAAIAAIGTAIAAILTAVLGKKLIEQQAAAGEIEEVEAAA